MTDMRVSGSETTPVEPLLTVANLTQEVEGLYEDLLNWDHGHEMLVVLPTHNGDVQTPITY